VKLGKHADISEIPDGNLVVTGEKVQVQSASAPPTAVPVGDVGFVISHPEFEKAVQQNEGFFENWTGAITAGVTLIDATQQAHTFTGGVALARTVPTETWLNPSSRTLVDFNAAYGKVSQPGVANLKTAIYHAGAEEDKYFSPSWFGFARLAYDHNFSQGLYLQQMYGGGIGWTVFKQTNQELDLTGGLSYIHQAFDIASANQALAGSTFGETFTHKFPGGILFNQQISVTPSWNNTRAYFATGSATLAVPVNERLSFSLSSLDTFLNDPPAGFKKNSFQFTAGLTYALK
jgi:hypothetical protein